MIEVGIAFVSKLYDCLNRMKCGTDGFNIKASKKMVKRNCLYCEA